jgi:two-component system sensor histidine kinase and response regulator WspE
MPSSPASPPPPAAETPSVAPVGSDRPKAPAASAAEPEDAQGRVVRVTAKNLNRLMGLAGESLVEARWLQPFAQSLLNLKREQDRLTDVIDELAKSLSPQDAVEGNKLIHELRSKMSLNREMLGRRIEEFESHARRSDDLNSRLYNEVIASRMRPMSDGVQGYPRMIRDISRQLGKSVNFEIVGETTPVDRDVLEKLDAPLNHILRNAIDHGIESPAERVANGKPETATLRLEARHSAGMFAITISDDGRGIDLDKLRAKIVDRKLSTQEMVSRMTDAELYEFLFLPGFSTRGEVTELSGRGVGLDVVHTMATSVGGTVRLQSKLGVGTSFHLHLPITLSVIRAVLVDIAGEPYAFPLNRIDRLLRVSHENIGSLEHRQFLRVDGQNVGVVLGTQILRMNKRVSPGGNGVPAAVAENKTKTDDDLFVVLFSNHSDQYGLLVDGFLGEQDLVVRPLDHRLGKVPCVSAAAVLDDGSPSLIIDVDDVRRAIERMLESGRLERTDDSGSRLLHNRKKRVLVVDDSITVREVERQLLTARGYDVTVAVDGVDGWNMVRDGDFDLVISDVDMPHMNGLELTKKIKDDPRLQVIPVVIVSYKDREEDRLRGLEAGANYYLTKSSFHDESLIDAVYTLIGESQSFAG